MKSISIYALVVAFACSALFVSSASAGGRRGTLGVSSSGMPTSAASTAVYPTGRSPLGEPVFLIPATSSTNINGGPIGGYVAPRAPLPPLKAPPSTTNTASLPLSTGTATAARTGGQGAGVVSVQPARSTRVIFTPPPTFVGVTPSVDGAATVAATQRAVDRFFSGSLLDTGLGINSSQSPVAKTVTVQGQTTIPQNAISQSATPWIRITPLQYAAPTIQGTNTSPTSGR